jgi:FMN phosphatase YigB (HAD superfamily)
VLTELFGASAFDFVLTSKEVGSEKPSPEIFQHALKLADAKGN